MIPEKPFNAEKYHAERAQIREAGLENCEGWMYCIGVPLIVGGWVFFFIHFLG